MATAQRPRPSEPAGDPAGPRAVPPARLRRTRAGSLWTAVVVTVLLCVALLVFIVQNGTSVPVHFLGVHGRFPLAAGLLAAAVLGALIVLVPGLIRMAQLRRAARHPRAEVPRH